MHEAGIARSIARALREQTLDGRRVVLHVRGGNHAPEAFDSSLLFHLQLEAPELDPAALEIVHDAAARLCVGCGREFPAARPDEPCPRCGGSSLPLLDHEQVEIELAG